MEDPSQLGVATIAHNWVGTLVSNYQIDTNCLLQLVRAMDMKKYTCINKAENPTTAKNPVLNYSTTD